MTESNPDLTAFLQEVGRLATTAHGSERFAQTQLLPYGLSLRKIRRIEIGDPRATLADLWKYATFLGLRTSRLVPQEHRPFDDLDERAADRSRRLQALTRLRRTRLPHPRSLRKLIRVRGAGPFATDSELLEKEPVIEIEWPQAVVAVENRIRECLASKILNETDALARTIDAFLMSDLELAQDIESFADPRSAWLHHPHNDEDFARALQQLAGHLQSYVAAAGALIDHARRFRRRYAAVGTRPGTEYDERIKVTFSGPESVIIGCLRNYALHHSLPLVVGEPQEATAAGWSTVILLDSVSLLDGDFSREEKSLLRTWPRGVPMASLVSMYTARVFSFYKWLMSRIPVWHRQADQELEALNRELQRALDDAGLGDLPRLFDQLERSKRGEIGATRLTGPTGQGARSKRKRQSGTRRVPPRSLI